MAGKGPSSLHAQRVRTAANVVVQIVLAILIVLMLNYLSFNRFGRWDLSRTGKYTLSGLTRKFLGSLKKEVKIYVFFSITGTKSPEPESCRRNSDSEVMTISSSWTATAGRKQSAPSI